METKDAQQVARDWLEAMSRTANARDHSAHMDLISKKVQVFGIPGFEVIGYDDWAAQCEHEFKERLLKSVSYEGLKVRVHADTSIMFKTTETVEGTDGTSNINSVEITIEQEDDGHWRVIQERVLSPEEVAYDRSRNGG